MEKYSPEFDEFDEFVSLDTEKKEAEDSMNTKADLFNTINYSKESLNDNTLETSDLLGAALELDELYIETNQANDNLRKKTVKKKTDETKKKFSNKPTKTKKLKPKNSNIENYKYAA